MKRIRKKVGIILGIILVALVVAVMFVHMFGGRALKFGIEKAASSTLNVDVTLEDVSFSVLGGWLKLKNLKVGNPEGYEHENLLELGSAEISMNIRSLLSDKIIVKTVKLDNVSLVIEQKEVVRNNLQEILDSLPSPKAAKAQAEKPGKKVQIDKLSVTNTNVKAKLLPIPGRLDTVNLTLAPIEMSNLGHDNKMTIPILVAKILRAIAVGIAEKGGGLLPDDMLGAMTSVLEASGEILKQTGKEFLEKGTDVAKELIEGGKDLGESVTEGLKGLLDPRKKQ